MSDSEQDHEELVRRRAYYLWEQAGQPDGRDEEFWHQARSENSPEDQGEIISKIDPSPVMSKIKDR